MPGSHTETQSQASCISGADLSQSEFLQTTVFTTAACRDPDGMTRSSELVMRLNGSEASDGTEFDLVFGRSEGRPVLLCPLAVQRKRHMLKWQLVAEFSPLLHDRGLAGDSALPNKPA